MASHRAVGSEEELVVSGTWGRLRPRPSTWALTWAVLRRNRLALIGLVYLGLIAVLIVVQPWLSLPSATRIDLAHCFAQPSSDHWLGTDESGRDVLARLIHGGQVSLAVGLSAGVLTVLLGTILGLLAGYFGGLVDHAIMRFTDGLLSIPVFFLTLAAVAALGSSAAVLVGVLACTRWMGAARLVRSEVLRYKNTEFITAAKSIGASNTRIMVRHLLPQAVPSIIVATSIGIGSVILVEAGLSFLGLGIAPPTPSWGNMLSNSQYYVWAAPHLAVYPGLMILLTVLAFNSLGDALRDILDPKNLR
jgi:peptide/nickel transport system permease protein